MGAETSMARKRPLSPITLWTVAAAVCLLAFAALNVWLADHPEEMARIRSERPDGPLAISHRTGVIRGNVGTAQRYDSIWTSDHFAVMSVIYGDLDEARQAGTDHGPVIADLGLARETPSDAGSSR